MNAIKTLLFGLLISLVSFEFCPPSHAWQNLLNGSANADDRASAVAVDSRGNILVCGSLNVNPLGTSNDPVFFVAKFSGDSGKELWRREIHGVIFSDALGLSIDAADNIAVGGSLNGDFAVVKLDGSTGAILWLNQLTGSEGFAYVVRFDSLGNVVAAGFITTEATNADFFAIKLSNLDGTELWRKTVNGPSNQTDYAYGLAIDKQDNVVVAGLVNHLSSIAIGYHEDLLALKLTASEGRELWRYGFELGAAVSVQVDPAGDVVIAGGGGADVSGIIVSKVAGDTGLELWRHRLDGPGAAGQAVSLDDANDVIVTGSLYEQSSGTWQFVVEKLSGTLGSELWVQKLPTNQTGFQGGLSIAIDGAADVVAAGTTVLGETSNDFTVLKFSGHDGSEIWRQIMDGGSNGTDWALACTLDRRGDVLAAGFLTENASGLDLFLEKLKGKTGKSFGR